MGCHKLHIANCSELKISFRNKTLTSAKSEKKARSYYPFGMPMQHMQLADGQRFGFNGKEKDTEGMGGGGSTLDYGFRIYNPQICKFLSVDPLIASYPWYTPYQFAGNMPIMCVDLDGLEENHYLKSTTIARAGETVLKNVTFGVIAESQALWYTRWKNDGKTRKEFEKNQDEFKTKLSKELVTWNINQAESYNVINNGRNTTRWDGEKYVPITNLRTDLGKQGTPAQAIRQVSESGLYSSDCAMMSQIITLYAALLEDGSDEKFNSRFINKYGVFEFHLDVFGSSGVVTIEFMNRGSDAKYYDKTGKETGKSTEEVFKSSGIGSRIAFTTDDPKLQGTAFNNENVFKVGENKYILPGLGNQVRTFESMESLVQFLNEQSGSSTSFYLQQTEQYGVSKPKE